MSLLSVFAKNSFAGAAVSFKVHLHWGWVTPITADYAPFPDKLMHMSSKFPGKILAAAVVILATVGWLAYTGVRDTKSYYVTINELNSMGNKAYSRNLRVAGNVAPGSIQRVGTNAEFVLLEQGHTLKVNYQGPNHRQTRSRMMPRRLRLEPMAAMAFSTRRSCRRNALRSMRRPSRVKRPLAIRRCWLLKRSNSL